jgi:hypothetical protein
MQNNKDHKKKPSGHPEGFFSVLSPPDDVDVNYKRFYLKLSM